MHAHTYNSDAQYACSYIKLVQVGFTEGLLGEWRLPMCDRHPCRPRDRAAECTSNRYVKSNSIYAQFFLRLDRGHALAGL